VKFATNAESYSVRFVSRGTANRKCTAFANVGVMLKGLRPTGGDGKSKRFSVRFSSLEGLLVYRGELTLKSPVAHRSAARRPGRRRKYKTDRERRAAKTRQQQVYRVAS
jgi:hypothetical protein